MSESEAAAITEKHPDKARGSFLGDLRRARRKIQIGLKYFYADFWPVSRSGSARYSDYFQKVIKNEPPAQKNLTSLWNWYVNNLDRGYSKKPQKDVIREMVEQKKQQGVNVRILDLMSYGYFIRDLGVQGCAVALTDRRRMNDKTKDDINGITFIDGDIMSPKTWRRITAYLTEQGTNAQFDFIICRPLGGLDYLPASPELYENIFYRVYPLLSSNDGVLLTQCHHKLENFIVAANAKFNSVTGLEARLHFPKLLGMKSRLFHNVFMLIKHPEAPATIAPQTNLGYNP